VPGVQAAVLTEGTVALSSAYGVADLATGTPLTPSHLFHVASHSKTFTATVVHQLAEAGRLRLDDPVGQWLPDLDGSPVAAVTLRALLCHGGGVVRDGRDGDFWALHRAFPDAAGLVAVARDEGAVLPANERFKYSNIGYSLLGLVIEAVTSRPYAEVVRDQVIGRLGLTRPQTCRAPVETPLPCTSCSRLSGATGSWNWSGRTARCPCGSWLRSSARRRSRSAGICASWSLRGFSTGATAVRSPVAR